jgi:hypothetical protein
MRGNEYTHLVFCPRCKWQEAMTPATAARWERLACMNCAALEILVRFEVIANYAGGWPASGPKSV